MRASPPRLSSSTLGPSPSRPQASSRSIAWPPPSAPPQGDMASPPKRTKQADARTASQLRLACANVASRRTPRSTLSCAWQGKPATHEGGTHESIIWCSASAHLPQPRHKRSWRARARANVACDFAPNAMPTKRVPWHVLTRILTSVCAWDAFSARGHRCSASLHDRGAKTLRAQATPLASTCHTVWPHFPIRHGFHSNVV